MIESFKLISPYIRLMRLDKPIGTFLLLWPTLWALTIASHGKIALKYLVIFSLGTVVMRAAGCVINDIADRNYDGHVKRTKNRPLAAKEISLTSAIILFGLLSLIGASLLFFLNTYCFILALCALGLIILYPFSKRFFSVPQFVLGITFSFGVIMAFTAVENHLSLIAFFLFLLTFLWIVAFDTLYALVDKDDDIKIGIHSSALFFEPYEKQVIIMLMVIVSVLWLLLGKMLVLPSVFYIFWLVSNGFFIYQVYLIYQDNRQSYFKAFLNNHWYGLLLFIALYFSY